MLVALCTGHDALFTAKLPRKRSQRWPKLLIEAYIIKRRWDVVVEEQACMWHKPTYNDNGRRYTTFTMCPLTAEQVPLFCQKLLRCAFAVLLSTPLMYNLRNFLTLFTIKSSKQRHVNVNNVTGATPLVSTSASYSQRHLANGNCTCTARCPRIGLHLQQGTMQLVPGYSLYLRPSTILSFWNIHRCNCQRNKQYYMVSFSVYLTFNFS